MKPRPWHGSRPSIANGEALELFHKRRIEKEGLRLTHSLLRAYENNTQWGMIRKGVRRRGFGGTDSQKAGDGGRFEKKREKENDEYKKIGSSEGERKRGGDGCGSIGRMSGHNRLCYERG